MKGISSWLSADVQYYVHCDLGKKIYRFNIIIQTLQHLLLSHGQCGGTKMSRSMGFVWRHMRLKVKEKPLKRVGKVWKTLHESAKMLIEFTIPPTDMVARSMTKSKIYRKKRQRLVLKDNLEEPEKYWDILR